MRTPGVCARLPHKSVELGTPTSASPLNVAPTFVVVVSTIGESPVTVMLSLSDATSSVLSTVSVEPCVTTMFWRTKGWKPWSSKRSA